MTDSQNNAHFAHLLAAARAQSEPQRLLFLFASAELPDIASAEHRQSFDAGEGGVLTPLMCVDKHPDELASFDALVAESRLMGQQWQVVFVAGLSGRGGQPPAGDQVEAALKMMADAVRGGAIERLAAYDTKGQPLDFG